MKLTGYPGYVRFWLASTISDFGTYITTIAISVIIVVRLEGNATDVGLVNAARWLPYLAFGLLAGVWVDRHRRKPILVAGDFGRGAILATIAALGLAGWLTIPALAALMLLFGALSLLTDAAFQSFLPQLVPRRLLVHANARLEQSESVAQTAGPAVAGWLTQVLTAPGALLIDAASFVFSGFVIASIPDDSRSARRPAVGGVWKRVREGLAWVYTHKRLGPAAWTTHLWFLWNSMFVAVFAVYALRERELGAAGLGVVLACAGGGALLGTSLSVRIGESIGAGRTMVAARGIYPFAFVVIAMAGYFAAGGAAGFAIVAAGQFLYGLALGVEGPQEMGYRQAVTPDRLIGRMSATMRSINRGMIVIGAPLGGLLAGEIGIRPTISVAAVGMVLVVVLMATSDLRNARMSDQLSDEDAAG